MHQLIPAVPIHPPRPPATVGYLLKLVGHWQFYCMPGGWAFAYPSPVRPLGIWYSCFQKCFKGMFFSIFKYLFITFKHNFYKYKWQHELYFVYHKTITDVNTATVSGFVQVLENLESPGLLFWHFPGLESPGKYDHWSWKVLEICWTQLEDMKCMDGSKENYHWDLVSVGINVNFRALEKSISVLEKSWKFVSGKGCKPCVFRISHSKLA